MDRAHATSRESFFGRRASRDKLIGITQGASISSFLTTPIGKGLLGGSVISPRGRTGEAGFNIVIRWPEATANKFSLDHAMELG